MQFFEKIAQAAPLIIHLKANKIAMLCTGISN